MLGLFILSPDRPFKPVFLLLLIVPMISIVMVFTNSSHNLFFARRSLYSIEVVYGAYFYFHSVYSYVCILIGVIFMFIAASRISGFFSRQSILVVAGILIAAVPNLLYTLRVFNMHLSVSTISFSVSFLCFTVAFLIYGFTSKIPISLGQVIDLISDGYILTDQNLRIVTFNKALPRLFPGPFTIKPGDAMKTFAEKYFTGITYAQFLECKDRAVELKDTEAIETMVPGGFFLNAEITPVMRNDAFAGCVVLLKDITQAKLMIEETQAASRAKSDFLSHMSHEIRTPLNAVIGMINIGMGTANIEKKDYCLERAAGASKNLLGIINNILDLSKIEADKFELALNVFDFEKMLINITNVAIVRADEKQLNFVVDFSDGVPAFIESDEIRLSQVITNLLTNAIKFTPEKGSVLMKVSNILEDGDIVKLKFVISDSGIGISEEQQRRLFAPFNQANANISKNFGGTGLGLAISKKIVELLNGDIWVESELGEGASFIFTMTAKKVNVKQPSKLMPNIRLSEIEILAVDDSIETREYFTHLTGAMKISCDVAKDGDEALRMMKEKTGKPYNIFFVDWQMPGMNGIELTKKIKETHGESSIVIMISVAEWNAIESEAMAAGVNCFVSKPIFPSSLINAINTCIGKEPDDFVSRERDEEECKYDFSKFHILIAEDVEINREMMTAILDPTGIKIDYAVNGKAAVSTYVFNSNKYNLIMMDVNMPEMDGHEATKTIRSLNAKNAREIPIIAMTANVFREDVEKCIQSGMNDHVGKPIDSDMLYETLDRYLNSPATSLSNGVKPAENAEWDESLLTGNTLVDMQHQKIFRWVSELIESCKNGIGTTKLHETLSYLVNYTIRHFNDEEALQLENGYPGYANHKLAHDKFKSTVGELALRFEINGSSNELMNSMSSVMSTWLVDHIREEDGKLIEFMKNGKGK